MKNLLKNIIFYTALLITLPIFIIYKIFAVIFDDRINFNSFSQFFSLLPGLPGVYLRKAFYYLSIKDFSINSYVGFGTVFSTSEISISDGVYIGQYCLLGCCQIGKNTLLASRVSVISGREQHNAETANFQKITIGANCWIGEAAIIAGNLGDNVKVAAGSAVFKDLPDNVTAIGNPARILDLSANNESR